MIRLGDAATLALTKLRTRKIRTIVTVITASLLFSALVVAVLVTGGVIESSKRFTAGSLSERYIVSVQNFFTGDDIYNNPDIQARAEQLQAKVIADKTAVAKRLGIEYDSKTEPVPVEKVSGGEQYLNLEALATRWAVKEHNAKLPTALDTTKQLADTYHPKTYYPVERSVINGQIKSIKAGKEDFQEKRSTNYHATPDVTAGWSYLDSSVVEPFLVDKKYLDAQTNKTDMPIIAPYSKVETALGLEKLPKTATPAEQLKRINQVRELAATVTFTTCYRNSVSQSQIDDAVRVAKEIEKNKGNKEYKKPSLIYGLPKADECAAAPIISNTRSAEEKKLTDKQLQFSREFDTVVDPQQQKVTFRVVGISPNGFDPTSISSVDGIIALVAGSSLQGMWVVPQGLYDAMPNKAEYARFYPTAENTSNEAVFTPNPGQLVEFAKPEDAKAFVTEKGCSGMDCSNKPFLAYFGSNSVLIQDLTTNAAKALGVVGAIIGAVAALILMGMVGRVISDSRRETAVFRAIGAKRNDIRAIYTTYTIFLTLLISLAALVIGTAAALWIDSQFSTEATVRAQLTFVGADGSQQFHLIGVWGEALLLIVALVVAAGLVSMLLPLARNLARSPIKDMRDDT